MRHSQTYDDENIYIDYCVADNIDVRKGEDVTFSATVFNDNAEDVEVALRWTVAGTDIAQASATVPGGGHEVFFAYDIPHSDVEAAVGGGEHPIGSYIYDTRLPGGTTAERPRVAASLDELSSCGSCSHSITAREMSCGTMEVEGTGGSSIGPFKPESLALAGAAGLAYYYFQ